jgi:hypothetical protein
MPITIIHSGGIGLSAIGFQQVTVSTAAVGFITPLSTIPVRAWLTVHSGGIRYRYDGNNPSTTNGHLLGANGTLELIGAQAIRSFRMICDGTVDAVVAYTLEI